jgi:hypothetical protein
MYRSIWFAYKRVLFILQGDGESEDKDTATTLQGSPVSARIWNFF